MKWCMKTLTAGQRKDFKRLGEERDRIKLQDSIGVTSNIAYMDDGDGNHCYDRYVPVENDRPLPIIVNFHGGGLITGNKEFNKCFCADIAEAGFAVYSIEYNKLPDHRLEELLTECVLAVNHIVMHATEREDPTRIYVTGDSGGGFLALFCTAVLRDPSLCRLLQLTIEEPNVITYGHPECKPQKLALISPLVYTAGRGVVRGFYQLMLYRGRYVSCRAFAEPEDRRITDALPPCFFVTSVRDNLLQDTKEYGEALQKQGKNVTVECFENSVLEHDFPLFHPEFAESRTVVKMITDFLGAE